MNDTVIEVDLAASKEDSTLFNVTKDGTLISTIKVFKGQDLVETADKLLLYYRHYSPVRIDVDSVGRGRMFAEYCRKKLKLPMHCISRLPTSV